MTCSLVHRSAIGDTLSLFAMQLKRDGAPVDLTLADHVQLFIADADGNTIVDGLCTVSVPLSGFVEYDFTSNDYNDANAIVAMNPETEEVIYYGVVRVYNGSGEYDTYPDNDDKIKFVFFNPAAQLTTPDPNVIARSDLVDLMKAPGRTRTVEGTIEERSVDELIKADQYLTAKANLDTGPPWGIRIAKTKPPSTTG